MYITKHFKLQELIPEGLFNQINEQGWELLDDRALMTLDALREKFGSMTINNYAWGGNRNWSGLRTEGFYKSTDAYLSSRSQHKYGRAFDVIFKDHTSKSVRDYIVKNPEEFPYITFLEIDIDWFHFDVRNTTGLKLWSPSRGFVTKE